MYRVASVRDPNDGSNRDFIVPNSHVTVLGISRTEETKLKLSFARNQGISIADGLECTIGVDRRGNGNEEKQNDYRDKQKRRNSH